MERTTFTTEEEGNPCHGFHLTRLPKGYLSSYEQHWNGALLDSVDAVIQYATSMTWKGKHPVVALVNTTYHTGVTLTKEAMYVLETQLQRLPSLEKWFVDITGSSPDIRDS